MSHNLRETVCVFINRKGKSITKHTLWLTENSEWGCLSLLLWFSQCHWSRMAQVSSFHSLFDGMSSLDRERVPKMHATTLLYITIFSIVCTICSVFHRGLPSLILSLFVIFRWLDEFSFNVEDWNGRLEEVLVSVTTLLHIWAQFPE